MADEEAPAPSFDDQLLRRVTADVGRWAFGTVAIESWFFNDEIDKLERFPAGTWWDEVALHSVCEGDNCEFCKITNEKSPHFVPTVPLAPGVGIPGALWSAVDASNANKVVWRSIEALANDPDQPYNPRLAVGAKLNLGWAAAIYFSANNNTKGIAIYYARKGVDMSMLRSETNEAYLVAASNLIAAAYAIREPRLAAVEDKKRLTSKVFRRIRIKLLALIHMGVTLENLATAPVPEKTPSKMSQVADHITNPTRLRDFVIRRILAIARKIRGANVKPPPPFPWEEALVTFVASLLSLLALARFNVFLTEEYGSDYKLAMGPLAALTMLHYGLTQAPASQPRNVILGQALSLSVGLGISNLEDVLDAWVRQAFSASVAITLMVKLGITHPPAAATALIFSSGTWRWTNMGLMMVANAMALGFATLQNNTSQKRQYPTFWGIGQSLEKARTVIALKENKKDPDLST